MSQRKLRPEKICQNCHREVELRFCGYCGQENVDPDRSFVHLFKHFIEDFTHYDNSFWRTIKYLFFRPGFLTKEYIDGKRRHYLPPVRMYIFISFAAYLLIGIPLTSKPVIKTKIENGTANDTIASDQSQADVSSFQFGDYTSVRELDSAHAKKPLGTFEYKFTRHVLLLKEKYTDKQLRGFILSHFFQSIPKTMFVFLPVFAFVLWLFHNKKRWYYFDHGIFTLHYFSFVLLSYATVYFISLIVGRIFNDTTIFLTLLSFLYIWWIYYFYRARYKFYHESKMKSIFKTTVLGFIYFWLVIIFFIVAAIYTVLSIPIYD